MNSFNSFTASFVLVARLVRPGQVQKRLVSGPVPGFSFGIETARSTKHKKAGVRKDARLGDNMVICSDQSGLATATEQKRQATQTRQRQGGRFRDGRDDRDGIKRSAKTDIVPSAGVANGAGRGVI